MQEEMLSVESRDFVTALASGLEVIQAFDHEHPRMTLSEVAARTGMNRAKARRFLLTLHALGYVRKQQRYFELAPRVLQLGLVAYWLLLLSVGAENAYTLEHNLVRAVDIAVLGESHLWQGKGLAS